MTEDEYVIELFQQHFSRFINHKIVLYGVGNNTKTIIETFTNYKITGLLDGYCEMGTVFGKPVLRIQDITMEDSPIIIIVARSSSTKIIWERIKADCLSKHIRVFDLFGRELNVEKGPAALGSLVDIPLSKQYICKQLLRYDVISFDIFDTLLLRRCHSRDNLYRMAAQRLELREEDFLNERIRAELAINNRSPYLHEIYAQMESTSGYTSEAILKLAKTEEELEEEMSFPNKLAVEIFRYALNIGKKVFLVSDMYIRKEKLEQILNRNGITGYEDLLVSCEYGTGKRQQLFEILRQKAGEGQYLHIGDDVDADGAAAYRNGIDSFLIADNEIPFPVGRPFISYHSRHVKLHVTDGWQLGYCLLGFIMADFTMWLVTKALDKEYGKILFLARDGFLLKKMYDRAIERYQLSSRVPESVYFCFSRSAGMLALTDESNLSEMAAQPYSGSAKAMLADRFALADEEIQALEENATLLEYLLQHKGYILQHARECRTGFEQYVYSLGLDSVVGKIAVVDLVSTGTCQKCLSLLLPNALDGFYLLQMADGDSAKHGLRIASYYPQYTSVDQEENLMKYYMILESLIKTPSTGTVRTYLHDGTALCKEAGKSAEHIQMVREVHHGILAYFEDYIQDKSIEAYTSQPQTADGILGYFDSQYSDISITQWKSYHMKDEYRNRNIPIAAIT